MERCVVVPNLEYHQQIECNNKEKKFARFCRKKNICGNRPVFNFFFFLFLLERKKNRTTSKKKKHVLRLVADSIFEIYLDGQW
jgi:hypothetical protein